MRDGDQYIEANVGDGSGGDPTELGGETDQVFGNFPASILSRPTHLMRAWSRWVRLNERKKTQPILLPDSAGIAAAARRQKTGI